MEEKSFIFRIYEDLVNAVSALGKPVYLGRPKNLKEEVAAFIVVNLPTQLRTTVHGGFGSFTECFGTFAVFAKAKPDGTMNVNAQTELAQSVIDLFPIVGAHIDAVEPSVLVQDSDGYGYFVTMITYKVRTKKR